ncbi:MAG: YceI family protein [Rhodobacteraceae bacterium]|nr:YceI family protein [Paracoccaceae bacterium]MCP5342069.1 YceI family protein [Paracoccaceae bacterium]
MRMMFLAVCLRAILACAATLAIGSGPLTAQDSADAIGWQLVPAASSVSFQSVYNQNVIETSKFGIASGSISPEGLATVRVNLDSVDTGNELRDARLRFLLFETFRDPEAVITASIDWVALQDLALSRRKTLTLPYRLDLHGVTRSAFADIVVTMMTNDMVSVSTVGPIALSTDDFAMQDGIRKLEEAAGVSIFPSPSVNFNFVFRQAAAQDPQDNRASPGDDAAASATQPGAPALPDISVAPPPETPPEEVAAPAPEPAAPAAPAASARGATTLRCKMTSYGVVPAGSNIKQLVPPNMTISINGKRARIAGVSNSVAVEDTGTRMKFRYSGNLVKIGPTDVSMSLVPSNGFLSVRTKARRSQAWEEDFPERAGRFTISGTCRRG